MPLKRPAASVLKKPAASAAEPDVAQLTTAPEIGKFLFGHDEDETSRRLALLSDSQRQTLTKMFERARKEHGQEYEAVSLQGAGANRKKGELLLAWLQHGFNETYCTLAAKIVMKQSRLTREEWIPLREAQRLYGRFELKKRLKKGSLESRRDPADPEFFQVRRRRELQETGTTKQKELKALSTGGKAGAKHVWDQLESDEQAPGWSDLKLARPAKKGRIGAGGGRATDVDAMMALLDEGGSDDNVDAESDNVGSADDDEFGQSADSEEEPPLALEDKKSRRASRSQAPSSKVSLDDVEKYSAKVGSVHREELRRRLSATAKLATAAIEEMTAAQDASKGQQKQRIVGCSNASKAALTQAQAALADNGATAEVCKRALLECVKSLSAWRRTRATSA
ncbi:unnamed protein product [Effrenium voratum]|uniref:Uncharacterized protein n=1 Tax=Effrenium voratum TaxID=2562239 RepID=A0AA36NJ51_9DINO|nr:unnamed protein product [Effrenium voratum]CAJ1416964.1 unnamed protein product [Effrenium voratum]